ncbi:ABC transporter permease [Arthrobacter sp. 24S4-2]|uniref:ABC transporter permease n=1 Tax=Arthrobacter sp. 24S4-2 TaxID=2575374 RepID=UPI0010C7B849|nr:ABC transporter permease [Arthrobacter sp. 24S4-2]QCO96464.1 ABC transporter permease [Arthrobacter sp. 24S4-2]
MTMTSLENTVATQEPKPSAQAPTQGRKKSLTGRRLKVLAVQLGIVVVLLGSWELLVRGKVLDALLYGQPSLIVNQLYIWVTQGTDNGSLGQQITVTIEEALIGFFIGTALGIVFGVAMGRIQFLSEVIGPFLKIVNAVPRIVLGSSFVVMFGLGLMSKVMLVIVLVFFGVFFNAFQGTREVDKNFIANAEILGASKWQVTRQVVIPSAFSWIIASLHVAFGFALIGAIVGEFLGSQEGLGNLIRQAQGNLNQNGIWAAMLIMAGVALIAEWLITKLENRLLRWRPPQHSAAAEA